MRAVLTRGFALLALAASVAHAAPWTPYGAANGGRFVSTHPTATGSAMIVSSNEELSTFATQDGGAHWIGNPFSVTMESRAWLAGSIAWVLGDRELLRSADQGRSWAPIAVPPSNAGVTIAGVNPANPEEVVLAGGDLVFHTSNAGATWSIEQSHATVQGASVDWTTRRIYAVASDGAILGRPLDTPGPWQVTAANARFVAAGHGIVIYGTTIPPFPQKAKLYRSTDQGATFSQVAEMAVPQEFFAGVAFSTSPSRIYAIDSRHVLRSDDGGATWQDGQYLLGLDTAFTSIAVDAGQPDRVLIATDYGVVASADGGATFTFFGRATGAPARPRSIAVDAVDPQRQWMVGPHLLQGENKLERTTDGGATWSVNYSYEQPIAASRQRPNTLFGWSGSSFNVSPDGGNTWSTTFYPNALTVGAFAQGGAPNVLILAGDDFGTPRLFVSVNDGESFSERASPPINVLAMAVAPSTSATIYAGGINYGGDILWRSTDGASSWQPIGSFPPKILGWQANHLYAVAVDPRDPARVYVGLVYPENLMRSDDGGATWTRVTKGLGAGAVTSIAIDPANPDTLYAAVYLSGVFRSTDRGATWSALDAGLRDAAVRQVALDPFRPGRLYAATNSGVYAVDLSTGLPAGRRRAIEFYHAAFNHYFVSADLDEITALDDGAFQGWQRTNFGTLVAEPQSPGNLPTCRFFGVGFGALSSHFYTPYPAECESLKTNPAWFYEKIAFGLALPDPPSHGCAPGTRPLFRAWNRNMGGAPNHRYMTSPMLLDAMIEFGWIFEGDLPTRVFACVPVE